MLAGIENGLAEVREALRQVAPAESLEACREDVRTLDRKIELIAETKPDSTALRPIEDAVSELKEIASHAATGEALTALAEELQTLGDRIDRFVIPATRSVDMLSSMDTRLQELATSINTRGPESEAASAQLILMVEALAEKIDKAETPANPVLDQITNQLSRLAVKFEASTTRLENLDSIERNMADLFARIEDLRTTTTGAAERAAKEAVEEVAKGMSGAAVANPAVDTLKTDIETLKNAHAQKDQRTQDTLEAVHDTLERLVDRLATVETDMRDELRTHDRAVRTFLASPRGRTQRRAASHRDAATRPVSARRLGDDHAPEPRSGAARCRAFRPIIRLSPAPARCALARTPHRPSVSRRRKRFSAPPSRAAKRTANRTSSRPPGGRPKPPPAWRRPGAGRPRRARLASRRSARLLRRSPAAGPS